MYFFNVPFATALSHSPSSISKNPFYPSLGSLRQHPVPLCATCDIKENNLASCVGGTSRPLRLMVCFLKHFHHSGFRNIHTLFHNRKKL